MDDEIVVKFHFTGGDADDGQLDFYEASRFQYGAARLIYTLEHFRQTGNILSKIYRDSLKADYRVVAASEGSWVQDVLLVSAPLISQCVFSVPIQAMVSYAFEQLFPFGKNKDNTINVLDAYKSIEEERTQQSIEETKRLTLLSQTNSELSDIIKLQIEKSELEDMNLTLSQILSSLQAAEQRQSKIEEYQDQFEKIEYETRIALIKKTRPQVAEIGRPLRRSAENLEVSDAQSKTDLVSLNYGNILGLHGNSLDPELFERVGSIKSYDKETGWGKWRELGGAKPISFQVAPRERNSIGDKVIESMIEDKIEILFQRVVDTMNETKHLILVDVLEIPEV